MRIFITDLKREKKTVKKKNLNYANCVLRLSTGRSDRSRIIDSQCEWGIRIVLFAKNSPPDCFLDAQTFTGSTPHFQCTPKKGTFWAPFSVVVGVTGVEPAASCSQSKRATICATPRFIFIFAYNPSFSYSIMSRLRFLLQYSRLTRLERFVILLIAPLLFPRFIRHRRRSETSPSALHPDLYLFLLIIPHLAIL